MGLFGSQPKKKNVGGKVAELDDKIAKLEAAGMMASAARLREERKKYDRITYDKTKALSPKEIKAQMRSAKAEGMSK